MVEHKQHSLKEFRNMSKEEMVKALVDELNTMSEEIDEQNSKTLFKIDYPYHFYFEKVLGYDHYYIAREDERASGRIIYIADFSKAQNKTLEGFSDISEPQQRLMMKFIISLEEGTWYE